MINMWVIPFHPILIASPLSTPQTGIGINNICAVIFDEFHKDTTNKGSCGCV